ncbi:hypothetical protein NKH77_28705 [Streptomyces sp. M19]
MAQPRALPDGAAQHPDGGQRAVPPRHGREPGGPEHDPDQHRPGRPRPLHPRLPPHRARHQPDRPPLRGHHRHPAAAQRPGATNADGGRYGTQNTDLGLEALLSLRDAVATDHLGWPAHSISAQVGYQWSGQQRVETGFGSTAAVEPLAVTTKPAHLYSYDFTLTVGTGGYWRFRSLLRGITSLGLLGTQLFVFRAPRADIIGGDGPIPAVRGKVLLSVPAEHSPDTDPHARGADNPTWSPTGSPRAACPGI